MKYQLRRYQLRPGVVDEFVQLWRDQVVPAREAYGFHVVGSWVNPETEEFVWIVGHQDDFEAADKAYYDSPERVAIDPDPKAFLLNVETQMMDRLD